MNSLPAKVRLQKIWVPACMPKCMTDQQDEPMHFKCRSKISVLKFSTKNLLGPVNDSSKQMNCTVAKTGHRI